MNLRPEFRKFGPCDAAGAPARAQDRPPPPSKELTAGFLVRVAVGEEARGNPQAGLTSVERATQFEPFGAIVQEQPARGGWRECAARGRYRSAGDGLTEVHETPISIESE